MENMVKLKVTKVTQGKERGNFVHTFKTTGAKISIGGIELANGTRTYYASLKASLGEGKEIEVDMNQFKVTENPYTFTDKDTNEQKTVNVKWLSAK
jgi:xanthine dehydrogenase molybdopterin-binding subunit B